MGLIAIGLFIIGLLMLVISAVLYAVVIKKGTTKFNEDWRHDERWLAQRSRRFSSNWPHDDEEDEDEEKTSYPAVTAVIASLLTGLGLFSLFGALIFGVLHFIT